MNQKPPNKPEEPANTLKALQTLFARVRIAKKGFILS